MKSLKKWNEYTAWIVAVIAFVTYLLTMEPTASFWDCGEFIACAYKLQVPHPPGAPFFLLAGRIFSLLAFGDVTKVAYWINMVSVLSSALTVFFLYKTITLLMVKTTSKKREDLSGTDWLQITVASAVGALAYAWSDSFWFSAVEAEVYAFSSLFTAVVVWAMLTWENLEDPAAANRRLILIAYLIGLSIGVHLLNLVTIPALALIYYFKKYPKPRFFGTACAMGSGLLILAAINSGIISGLPELAGKFELFFVNTLGLPYHTGVGFFAGVFLGGLVWGIGYSQRKGMVLLNTALLSLAFILIGYASYALILVRSGYNTPINENSPDNVLQFVYYLKREQYESRPLLYGPSFVSKPVSQERGAPVYAKKDGKYVLTHYKPVYKYDPSAQMLLPRLQSSQPGHADLYRQKLGLAEGEKPTMKHNISYLLHHQLNHMYWRYFFWNFAGRESDQEGAGALLPWDVLQHYPASISGNRAHDNFLMVPLLLGIAGILYMYRRRRKDVLVLGLLFALTGFLLAFYLNTPPAEPRERDYIYVGSFYIFCIWIGFGVMAMVQVTGKIVRNKTLRLGLAGIFGFSAPLLMVIRGWDNHDRSNRYHSVDFARNLLNSCAPNAILFTGGDNDTFPLWYVQEVEGFRTDVRVCVQTYLGADWYIRQLKRKINDSDPLPLSLDSEDYRTGKNEYIPFYEIPAVRNGINLKEYLGLIHQDHKAIQVPLTTGEMTAILPSSTFFLPVDTARVKEMKIVGEALQPFLSDSMSWKIGNNDLYKGDLVILDIIATNNWKRPVYFSSTMGASHNLGLKAYMQLEGYAYRLLPVQVPGAPDGYVNATVMYGNLMHKMWWRNLDNPAVYYDETYRGAPVQSARLSFLRLAEQLITENQIAKAKKVLNKALTVMPDDTLPYDPVSVGLVGALFDVGESQKALDTAKVMADRSDENLTWLGTKKNRGKADPNIDLFILQRLAQECRKANYTQYADRLEVLLRKHLKVFYPEMN